MQKKILLGILVMIFSLTNISMGLAKEKKANMKNETISVERDAKTQKAKDKKKKRTSIEERIKAILDEGKRQKKEKEEAKQKENPLLKIEIMSAKSIFGTSIATESQCVKHLLRFNPHPHINTTPEELVHHYYEEAKKEGIRPDVAFAQALKETGYFRFGGTVLPEQNNYCGLGTTNTKVKGAYFATPLLGVRAHIQHLLAYASTRKPKEKLVDPRYDLVRETYKDKIFAEWKDLNGRWAVPGKFYGESILQIFERILEE